MAVRSCGTCHGIALTRAFSAHLGVCVHERLFARGDNMADDRGAVADLPEGSASGQMGQDAGLGFGEADVVDSGADLVGGLAVDDLGRRTGPAPGPRS